VKIDAYEFGKIVIEGKAYTEDALVFDGRVVSPWRRNEGHLVTSNDLAQVWIAMPDALVVGTGAWSCMRVPKEILAELKQKGIECISEPTTQAVTTYNRWAQVRQVVGAFHLTC
jgi:hypothetical protein